VVAVAVAIIVAVAGAVAVAVAITVAVAGAVAVVAAITADPFFLVILLGLDIKNAGVYIKHVLHDMCSLCLILE
jgi:hypothetical protein